MTSTPTKERASVFTTGAAYGFVAGVFAMALIVWQFGSVLPTRQPGSPGAVTTKVPPAVEGAAVDAKEPETEPPVLETLAPPATPGGAMPEVAAPTMGPPLSEELKDRVLLVPVEGIRPDQLTPQFADARGGRRHEAIDILAPTGTPVKAVEGGRIARLFFSKAGGITIYQFDPTEKYCYYYAHLDRYASGLREGDKVTQGQVIGYVGISGNAPKNTPHLHFAVFRLNAEKKWWEGVPIDPYEVLR